MQDRGEVQAAANRGIDAMTARSTLSRRLRRDQRGNIMYMTAAMLLPMIATIGAGIDLGQAYMAKARLQQACDAGVLAGRRAMAEGTFTSDARHAADRMFETNYPEDIYQSRDVEFNATSPNASDVTGTASATVDTILMHMFGKEEFNLSVDCAARLEIANTDIMFVLDTTGSMLEVNAGDSVNRISALRDEVMAFYDTVSGAQTGTAQIRYGVVPYSSNVNVGRVLLAENPNWMSNTTELPSREANFRMVQPPDQTTYGAPFEENISFSGTGTPANQYWSNTSTYFTGYSNSACNSLAAPSPTSPSSTTGTSTTATGTTTDQNGNTVTTYERRQGFRQTVYRYRYDSASRRCYRQSRRRDWTQVTPFTVTQFPPQQQFRDYTYTNRTIDVSALRTGGTFSIDTGFQGADVNANWNGCIMERDTIAFSSTIFPPEDALDLDIDLIPNGDDRTKWKFYLPNIAYPRTTNAWSFQSPDAVTTSNEHVNYASGSHVSGGWAACPSEVMRLRTIARSQRSQLQNYVNGLVAVGGTYHDAGMVWGTRLISPTGIFGSDNDSAPNGAPISRHIIFMTDGQMAPNAGIYGFQGQEYTMERVGSTDSTELRARHNTRFQAVCNAARTRNITVWVVAFGTTLSNEMQACATAGNAFQASNKAQLHARFQQIAQQITRLRLQQ